jgi:cytochrome c553
MMNRLIVSGVVALLLGAPAAQAVGDPVAGKQKAQACFACHGENGIATQPIYPHIGGQYADYMLHALKGYKSGERKNAIMQGMVAPLSEQDMADISAYYAGLEGVLKEGTLHP